MAARKESANLVLAVDPRPRVLIPVRPQRGFTLMEVLVSMLIAVIGLLGLVGMQMRSQQAELEAYQRAQAVILLSDILDRINTNRGGATCYAGATPTSGTPYLGTTSGGSHYDP